MTRYLVATASAETTAAACDYLAPKLEDGDEVHVLTVDEDDASTDGTALRLAQAELPDDIPVRTFRRSGDPSVEIVAFVREQGIDEVVLGPRRADGAFSSIGTTTRVVLNKVEGPVFVVPR